MVKCVRGVTVEPLNKGHIGGRVFVHCREVVPLSEVANVLLACQTQSVGAKQFVLSTEVVLFWEGPLSEVPL